MKYIVTKHNSINIASEKKSDIDLCINSLNFIKQTDDKFANILKSVEHIIFGKYTEGSAVAATFAGDKAIVLTPPEDISINYLSALLIHESTHVDHYCRDPNEYMNQIMAETLAFKNEISFLEKIKDIELIKEAEKVRDNLISILKEYKETSEMDESTLKENQTSMSEHEKILMEYKKYKNLI